MKKGVRDITSISAIVTPEGCSCFRGVSDVVVVVVVVVVGYFSSFVFAFLFFLLFFFRFFCFFFFFVLFLEKSISFSLCCHGNWNWRETAMSNCFWLNLGKLAAPVSAAPDIYCVSRGGCFSFITIIRFNQVEPIRWLGWLGIIHTSTCTSSWLDWVHIPPDAILYNYRWWVWSGMGCGDGDRGGRARFCHGMDGIFWYFPSRALLNCAVPIDRFCGLFGLGADSISSNLRHFSDVIFVDRFLFLLLSLFCVVVLFNIFAIPDSVRGLFMSNTLREFVDSLVCFLSKNNVITPLPFSRCHLPVITSGWIKHHGWLIWNFSNPALETDLHISLLDIGNVYKYRCRYYRCIIRYMM